MKTSVLRLGVLALAASIVACSGKNGSEPKGASDNAPAAAALPLAKQLDNLGALTDLIVAEANDLPRAEFDPAALVAAIGKDPQKLFEWVRDKTYWAPYRGLLRGAKGVMLDRVGSSLDRAVLLGDLLRHAGYTVRLAHAEFSEARARELLGKVRSMPVQRRAPVSLKDAPTERRRATATLIPDFDNQARKLGNESRRIATEAEALVRSQSETLLSAVRAAAGGESNDEGAATAALRDHWWIECDEGGKWSAMDVLLPEARMGEATATASAVSAWPGDKAWPSIPDTEWQSVQLRVVVERYEAGATSESTVLESLVRPAEQIERPITLGHMPLPWPTKMASPANPNALREAALAVRAWLPFLRVGDELISQSGFSIQGDLVGSPSKLTALSKTGGAEQAGNFASALGGFGGDEVGPAATAEWLDYEIRIPGTHPERLRRPVFDLLGPARRASKAADFNGNADLRKIERFEALFSHTDVLMQVSDFTDEFVASLLSSSIVANQALLHDLSRERDPAKASRLAAKILGRLGRWGPLPSLVLWRSTLAGQSMDTFPDRPNILNYRVGQTVGNSAKPTFHALIDIASNATGARRTADRSPFDARVRQGVTDTVAEMLTLGNDLQMAANTASIFARLASEGSRGLVIAARDQNAAKALPWPEDETARVATDVEAGFIAVVPRKALLLNGEQRVGWWRVDPVSGETIGVMDTGMHAGADEDVEVTALVDDIEAFLAENPVEPAPVIGSPARAAWQMRYGGLAILHQALYQVLRMAWDAGFCVPTIGPC